MGLLNQLDDSVREKDTLEHANTGEHLAQGQEAQQQGENRVVDGAKAMKDQAQEKSAEDLEFAEGQQQKHAAEYEAGQQAGQAVSAEKRHEPNKKSATKENAPMYDVSGSHNGSWKPEVAAAHRQEMREMKTQQDNGQQHGQENSMNKGHQEGHGQQQGHAAEAGERNPAFERLQAERDQDKAENQNSAPSNRMTARAQQSLDKISAFEQGKGQEKTKSLEHNQEHQQAR